MSYTADKAVTIVTRRKNKNTHMNTNPSSCFIFLFFPLQMIDCFEFQILVRLQVFVCFFRAFQEQHLNTIQLQTGSFYLLTEQDIMSLSDLLPCLMLYLPI